MQDLVIAVACHYIASCIASMQLFASLTIDQLWQPMHTFKFVCPSASVQVWFSLPEVGTPPPQHMLQLLLSTKLN